MDTATIIKNGSIVKTNNIIPLSYYTSGHLSSFKANNVVYHHFENNKEMPEGYFDKIMYQNYKAQIISDFNLVKKFNDWKYADFGDKIIIRKRLITYSGQQFISNNTYCWNEYNLIYSDNHKFGSNEIDIDSFTLDTSNSLCNSNALTYDAAYGFFTNNIIQANLNDIELINTISNIAQIIQNIEDDIFTAFESNAINDDLKQTQRIKWSVAQIISPNDEISKKNYYEAFYLDINNYYSAVTDYLILIKNGSDIVKSIALASCLHPNILKKIPLTKKKEMIKYIIKEFFVVDELLDKIIPISQRDSASYIKNGKKNFLSLSIIQNLIVNLIWSFSENDLETIVNGQIVAVDSFLDFLLNINLDGIINEKSKTFFEIIYNNLNEPYNITDGVLNITNWVFNTNYKANTTRAAFIQGVYFLWQLSKYNPYDENGNLKTKSIGFKRVDTSSSSLSSYNIDEQNASENIGCKFYYSNEVGFTGTVTPTEHFQQSTYIKHSSKYANASPIVIPYESEKHIGMYFDNFTFDFNEKNIVANINKVTGRVNRQSHIDFIISPVLYGTYHLYQPISLINTNLDTKSPILTVTGNTTEINGQTINSLIPIFVLKYIDDSGDQSDEEKMLGYLVDGALTFSGIGNLAKLKHLRWATFGVGGLFTKQGLRVLLGSVEFSSGVIGFFANFVECTPPTEPENPSNAEEWEDYRFCQNMQSFIMIFQIATLSVSSVDTIATLALKKQAARVINSAGGGATETAIRNNVKTKLNQLNVPGSNSTIVNETAENITDLGKEKFLNTITDLLIEVDKIYNKIHPKILKRINNSNGAYSKSFFNQNYNENNLKIIIQDFFQNGVTDTKTIEDFITLACRADLKIIENNVIVQRIIKGYTFTEARIVINYYLNVIRKRGYPTGFHSLQDYKLFSQKAKTYLDDFCNQWGISNQRYEVQGSVQFKSHPDDPNFNDTPTLTRNGNTVKPDDFDGRIYMSQNQANNYKKKLTSYYRKKIKLENPGMKSIEIQKEVDYLLTEVSKGIKKGMITKFYILPSDFLENLKQAVKRENGTDIFYPKNSQNQSEVGFSIIIKGSPYDIDPVMSLKY